MKNVSLLFGLLLLTACSSGDMIPESDPLEIELLSGTGSSVTVETRGEGVINSSLTSNLSISLLHQERPKGGMYPTYSTGDCMYAELKYTDLIGDKYRVLNNPKLYYREDGGETRFWGWYPHANKDIPGENLSTWDAGTQTVTFDIDGSTDILLAERIVAHKDDRFGLRDDNTLTFRHVLSKVVVWVALENEEFAAYWSDITAIEFVNRQQQCQLIFPAPNAVGKNDTVVSRFPASLAHLKMRAKGGTEEHKPIRLTSTEKTEVGYAMLAPHKTADAKDAQLEIRITTAKGSSNHTGGVHTVIIPYGKNAELCAGGSYNIYLTFDVKEVSFAAEIKPWGTNNQEEGTVF